MQELAAPQSAQLLAVLTRQTCALSLSSEISAMAHSTHSTASRNSLSLPWSEWSRTERARVAVACAWMQLLKLQKTATSHGCSTMSSAAG